MFAHRAAFALPAIPTTAFVALAAPLGLALLPSPAAAQIADDVVINILRECSRIDDPSARLACYDNNIRSAGGAARNTVPGQVQVQGGAGAVYSDADRATGFGHENIRTQERFAPAPAGEVSEIAARVTDIELRGNGIYAITLEDGAEWIFAESVGTTYSLPRRGARVEIRRGALQSFLMRYNNQAPVQVRRIR